VRNCVLRISASALCTTVKVPPTAMTASTDWTLVAVLRIKASADWTRVRVVWIKVSADWTLATVLWISASVACVSAEVTGGMGN
jgi:hypothetical protein